MVSPVKICRFHQNQHWGYSCCKVAVVSVLPIYFGGAIHKNRTNFYVESVFYGSWVELSKLVERSSRWVPQKDGINWRDHPICLTCHWPLSPLMVVTCICIYIYIHVQYIHISTVCRCIYIYTFMCIYIYIHSMCTVPDMCFKERLRTMVISSTTVGLTAATATFPALEVSALTALERTTRPQAPSTRDM